MKDQKKEKKLKKKMGNKHRVCNHVQFFVGFTELAKPKK
jgi:hypothetical protein